MLRTWCKADGNHFPGDVIDIDDATAKEHIKNGHAIDAADFDPEHPPAEGDNPASLSAQAARAAAEASAPAAPAAS